MPPTPHLAVIAYASCARIPLADGVLASLLSRWRVANARRGITGLVILHGGSFFQVLEGFPDDVEELWARIAVDPRHDQVVRLIGKPIERRSFGDWSMGHARTSAADLALIPGLAAHIASGGEAWRLDPHQARSILSAYTDPYWRRTIA